ncbi:MAG: DUF456 domain-containing protein [Deltaproteobacteria bacterium]
MDYLAFILFFIAALGGLISLVFGLPGAFIILAAAVLYGWYGEFSQITTETVIILAILAALSEVLDFALGIAGAKKRKSSNKAVVGSIIGGVAGAIVGAPLFFGIGAVIGAFVGAFAGAFIVELIERKGLDQAVQSGWGAFLGKLSGTLVKGIIGITMIVLAVVSVAKN